VPPLRERRDDIPLLVEHFLQDIASEHGLRPKTITREALDALSRYHWPGNVRELRNTVERLLIMAPGDTIALADVPAFLGESPRSSSPPPPSVDAETPLREARAQFERDFITRALNAHNWNVSKTAETLGLERSHLHRKIKLLGIDVRPDTSPNGG